MVASDEVVVAAHEVERRFGTLLALDRVTLEIRRGQLFGLVGPDGAGKTTLIRVLAGLIGYDGGTVRVFGADPLSTPALRDSMGVMPQHYSLYGDLSVGENLRFFARLYCLPRKTYNERANRLLELTRLGPFLDRRADALSGGMYKKLALACALLHEPEVLLLDEPTNGVDPVSRRELWDLLHEFVSAGMAVLISTAYMDEAARCHEVCLLHHGRVVAKGEPRQLVSELEAPVFEVIGGRRDELHALFEKMSGIIGASPAGERLRVVLLPDAVSDVASRTAALGAHLVAVTADFEDVFLTRTHVTDPTPTSTVRGAT